MPHGPPLVYVPLLSPNDNPRLENHIPPTPHQGMVPPELYDMFHKVPEGSRWAFCMHCGQHLGCSTYDIAHGMQRMDAAHGDVLGRGGRVGAAKAHGGRRGVGAAKATRGGRGVMHRKCTMGGPDARLRRNTPRRSEEQRGPHLRKNMNHHDNCVCLDDSPTLLLIHL